MAHMTNFFQKTTLLYSRDFNTNMSYVSEKYRFLTYHITLYMRKNKMTGQ